MKKTVLLIILGLGLAGCGADGNPLTPSIGAGVSINQNGISPHLGVGVNKGPLHVGIGL